MDSLLATTVMMAIPALLSVIAITLHNISVTLNRANKLKVAELKRLGVEFEDKD